MLSLHCCLLWELIFCLAAVQFSDSINPEVSLLMQSDNDKCPDGHTCLEGSGTCCVLSDGKSYGCCPFTGGVCCSDHQHCCPAGTDCDLKHQMCKRKDNIKFNVLTMLPWLKLSIPKNKNSEKDFQLLKQNSDNEQSKSEQLIESHNNVEFDTVKVLCGNGSQSCADGYTCCESTVGGIWGCCPQKNGVCCDDKIHCCPEKMHCESGKCSNLISTDEVAILNIVQDMVNVVCPGGEFQCPDRATCCSLGKTGNWGCCPLENATCCLDFQHCCPNGYVCIDGGVCAKSNSSFQAVKIVN